MAKVFPIFNYFGGKYYLADFIIEHFPSNYPKLEYREVCIGAGSVFLNKKPSVKETISDINLRIINIWRTVRDSCETFQHRLSHIDYSFRSWNYYSALKTDDPMTQAVATYVKYRMSRSGRGDTYGYSTRQRGDQDESLNKWEKGIAHLTKVSERCQGVHMLTGDATTIVAQAKENELIYIDPPYVESTRAAKDVYEYEMSDSDHVSLIAACLKSKAKILISMYNHPVYIDAFKNWRVRSKILPNHSGESRVKQPRVEMIWMNYE